MSAHQGELPGLEHRAVVAVDLGRDAPLQDGLFETVQETHQVLGKVELGVADQPGVVVQEGHEIGAALFVGVLGIRQPGPVADVGLPQAVGAFLLEAAKSPGRLGEQPPGLAQKPQVPGQSGDLQAVQVHGRFRIHSQDLHNLPHAALRQFFLQGHGLGQHLGAYGPGSGAVAARPGFQTLEASVPVGLQPAA